MSAVLTRRLSVLSAVYILSATNVQKCYVVTTRKEARKLETNQFNVTFLLLTGKLLYPSLSFTCLLFTFLILYNTKHISECVCVCMYVWSVLITIYSSALWNKFQQSIISILSQLVYGRLGLLYKNCTPTVGIRQAPVPVQKLFRVTCAQEDSNTQQAIIIW